MTASLEIMTGRKKKPFNVVLFGVPGIGKSTWAASTPRPVFIGAEENDELEVSRFPIATSYDDFLAQLTNLNANPRGHQTVVIDTLDSVEKLLHKKLLANDPKGTGSMMAAYGGYGKAYEKAESELVHVRELLKSLRDNHGMNVVLLAHSKKTKATDTILGLEYDTYELNLHQRAQNLFIDWVSAVLFANYVAHAKEGVNSDKVFAMGHGTRVLLTEKRPGHLGKNRYMLDYELPLEFPEFKKQYDAFYAAGVDPKKVIALIDGAVANIKDESVKAAVTKSTTEAGEDVVKLQKILTRVQELTGA